jgi:hypothetical protein
MKIFRQIIKILKDILFIPRNLANISRHSANLAELENKLDALNQKLNNLSIDSISKNEDVILQNRATDSNIKTKESINFEISELVSKQQEGFETNFLQFESLLSIYNTLPNLKYLPATRGWAGSPDFLNKIIEVILKLKPRFVLEISSGVSSVVIGLALKMNNYGRALSLEQNISYAEITRKNIEVNDIEDISIIMNSPLNDYLIDGETWKWYETNKLTFTDKIDLLIIDGPPRTTQRLARYPAIPILHNFFSDNVIILLDDANRLDEKIIIERWIEYLTGKGFEITIENYSNFDKGMALVNIKKITNLNL